MELSSIFWPPIIGLTGVIIGAGLTFLFNYFTKSILFKNLILNFRKYLLSIQNQTHK